MITIISFMLNATTLSATVTFTVAFVLVIYTLLQPAPICCTIAYACDIDRN